MSKKIELTQGKVTLVDDDVFEELSRYKWYAVRSGNTFYAVRTKQVKGKKRTIRMHRQVLKCPDKMLCDHINRNGLDNTRRNLRVVSVQQNTWNRKLRSNNSSGLRGVVWNRDFEKWAASIGYNGKRTHLGYFDDKNEAGLAYDRAAIRLRGELTSLNFPKRGE